jgi:hypothetical protein
MPGTPLERVDFADDDLDGLIEKRAIGGLQPRLHLLDGEADGRERVLEFVRGLARERLPARQARQVASRSRLSPAASR